MDFVEISRSVFEREIAALAKVSARIGNEMHELVELIYCSQGKVVVTGIGKTGHIGRKIAASLASTGTPAIFMNATEAVHGDLGMLSRGDIVLAISNSGSSLEIINILPSLRKLGTHLVAMTGRPDSVLGKEADIVLSTAVDAEACPLDLAPTCSTTACLVMGDALCVSLMQRRGFSSEQYALFHPGGALGRRLLTRVEDLMSREIPCVQEDDFFHDVIYTISDRRKGLTMVADQEGQLRGIITDGDIRRALQRFDKVLHKQARDFMTRSFKKISARAQIEDALRMMTQNKITSLAVTENATSDKIIGLITIHDIIDCEK